jgi:hypothetical protein
MTATRVVLVALLTAMAVLSSSVKSWDISDYESFLPGTLQGVSVTREGLLSLAPRVAELHRSDAAVVWTAAATADGTIYLGTGHQGRLYKIPPAGGATLLWTAPQIEIFALAAAPNGDLYAATSPSGKVFKITPDGAASEFFDPGQEYIWRLQFAPATANGGFGGPDALYVGTGPSGQIYRVTADGRGELWFDAEQRHITALALDAEGRLLAAADPSGTLFRVDGKDRAFALYDSTLPEIRNIQAAADGSIYLAAMGGAISLSDNMTQAVSQAAATTTITVTATASGAPAGGVQTPSIPTPAQSMPTIASSPAVNYGVETAALILLRPGEQAETLWTSTEENILAMALEDGGTALIATDRMGRLYRVNAQGAAVLLAQTDEQQITSLTPSSRGLVMTAAHGSPTRLMATDRAASGRYETAPFDASAISAWGRLESRTTGNVVIQTRSGNTARPDKTWSPWTPVSGGVITSPPARYLQWAADFTAPDQTLDAVRVAYLPANAKPAISSVTVSTEASSSTGGSSSAAAAPPSPFSITVTADGSPGSAAAESDSAIASGGAAGRQLRISWQASDQDGDALLAKIEFRGEGESNWKLVKDRVEESQITLPSEVLADGRYRFRVTVSDRKDNPGDTARTAERISSLVLIDHTPPVVQVSTSTPAATRFSATDQASPVVAAHYSVDAGEWIPLRSDDGIADSQAEGFTVSTEGLPSGERLVTIRVRDRAGNAGLAKTLVVRP